MAILLTIGCCLLIALIIDLRDQFKCLRGDGGAEAMAKGFISIEQDLRKPVFDYFATTTTYGWLDTVEDPEMALALAVRHFWRNSGGEQFPDWTVAMADLERRGLASSKVWHGEIVKVMSSSLEWRVSELERIQARSEDLFCGAAPKAMAVKEVALAMRNIRACLQHLLPLNMEANTAPALAPSRRAGRL